MRESIVVLGLSVLLLLSGCAQSGFDINNRGILFQGGKPYLIPYNTHYGLMNKITAGNYKTMGVDCPAGNVFWMERNYYEKLNRNILRDPYGLMTYGVQNNLASCARPLSNQEYQYVLNHKNQQQSNSYSTKERLNGLNKQLNQMNNNMAKRSSNTPSYNSNPSSYKQRSSSSAGYKGDSGAKYQYDSTKYEDRIRYQYDYNAQHRDRMYKDYSGDRESDTSDGQYGTGIYGQ